MNPASGGLSRTNRKVIELRLPPGTAAMVWNETVTSSQVESTMSSRVPELCLTARG